MSKSNTTADEAAKPAALGPSNILVVVDSED